MLFKVTSWGLLVTAWAWFVFSCETIENDYVRKDSFNRVAGVLGPTSATEPSVDQMLREFNAPAAPNSVVRFIGQNATYVFPAGILGVAWCYACVGKFKLWPVTGAPAEVCLDEWRDNWCRMEIGLRFLIHGLICWFLTFMFAEAVELPAAGILSFLAAVVITILERSWVMSERNRKNVPGTVLAAPNTPHGDLNNG
jgi:hypothetical protein